MGTGRQGSSLFTSIWRRCWEISNPRWIRRRRRLLLLIPVAMALYLVMAGRQNLVDGDSPNPAYDFGAKNWMNNPVSSQPGQEFRGPDMKDERAGATAKLDWTGVTEASSPKGSGPTEARKRRTAERSTKPAHGAAHD